MRIIRIEPLAEIGDGSDNDWADILVELDNGLRYVFTLQTPEYFHECMRLEGKEHYVGEPCIVVKRLDMEHISAALHDLVGECEEFLESYGTLQATEDEGISE